MDDAEVRMDVKHREAERCAQACENMIVHEPHWNPDGKLSIAEALAEAARRIRAGEYGPIDFLGWRPPK